MTPISSPAPRSASQYCRDAVANTWNNNSRKSLQIKVGLVWLAVMAVDTLLSKGPILNNLDPLGVLGVIKIVSVVGLTIFLAVQLLNGLSAENKRIQEREAEMREQA